MSEPLNFTHGRLTFSLECFEMMPSLPEKLELRVNVYSIADYGFDKSAFIDFDSLRELLAERRCVWLHLSGTISDELWKELASFADLSDEQVKYLKNPHSRSFIDEHFEGIFWTALRPFITDKLDGLETINFFLTDRILLTRQFSHDDAFTHVVHRLFSKGEEIKDMGADCLAAELMEFVIRSYYDALTVGGAKLEQLQTRIVRHPGKEELNQINRAQQIVWIFLKSIWPLDTITKALARSKSKLISEQGRHDFTHCHEEAASVLRLFETYRDMSYDIMDVYVSGLGLRTNETTKVLTVIATMFLPPTLIAGIYGMNFQIPEVHYALGYYLCLSSMALVSGGLLFWLKTRGYLDF